MKGREEKRGEERGGEEEGLLLILGYILDLFIGVKQKSAFRKWMIVRISKLGMLKDTNVLMTVGLYLLLQFSPHLFLSLLSLHPCPLSLSSPFLLNPLCHSHSIYFSCSLPSPSLAPSGSHLSLLLSFPSPPR